LRSEDFKAASIAQVVELVDTLASGRAIEERQPEVSTAYSKGKAMAIADVATSLYEQAKNGNIQAAKFYLKTQAGWREHETTTVTASPDNVIQIIRTTVCSQ
jgi:hypothetical protein|tara:strand:+ start:93 stop:398 length:306 start_codon:yes stop_codon:yes gene_type:complete